MTVCGRREDEDLHEVIDKVALDEEISRRKPILYYDVDLPDIPLTRLGDRAFEALAYSLTDIEIQEGKSHFTKATLLRAGADEGRDVLLFHNEIIAGAIQCKCYNSTIGLPMVLKELMRFALLAVRKPALVPNPSSFQYQYWTAGEITADAQNFFNAPKTYINANRESLKDAAVKARRGVVGLECQDPQLVAVENERACDLVMQFGIISTGPIDIKSRLADHAIVRKRFFRGPNDQAQRAQANEIELLMDGARKIAIPPISSGSEFVRRRVLERNFETFMASPARVMVVVGGNGYGKTTWVRQTLENPPPAVRVDVIRGEDIGPSDRNIAETIARILKSQRLGSLTEVDLNQGVIDWLDDTNRLIIVDGLDRVSSVAMQNLPEWLSQTLGSTITDSVRFILTSRSFTWNELREDIRIPPTRCLDFHGRQTSEPVTIELSHLTTEEIYDFYQAYGLKLTSRPFRIPGLISIESKLMASEDQPIGRRAAVLGQSLQDWNRRLRRAANIGPQHFEGLISGLGDLLIESGDGRVSASAFRKRTPELIVALDAALTTDFAQFSGDEIRIDPDDVVEHLMALRLHPDQAKDLLENGGSDLLIGATALSVALLEMDGEQSVRSAIELLMNSTSYKSSAFAAACRAVTELKDRALIREEFRRLLSRWKYPNNLLHRSPLLRLMMEVDLSPLNKLEDALILAPKEDPEDWRAKYFYNPELEDERRITGFGVAIANIIAEDPLGSLLYLLQIADSDGLDFDRHASVCSGLIFLAIRGCPLDAAKVGWERKKAREDDWLFGRVQTMYPETVAALLGSVAASGKDRDAAIQCLWVLSKDPPVEKIHDVEFRSVAARAASDLLPHATSSNQRVQLLIIKLLCQSTRKEEAEIEKIWAHVTDNEFWLALRVTPQRRLANFRLKFLHTEQSERLDALLAIMPADLFSAEEWLEVTDILRSAAARGFYRGASMALENLFHRAATKQELDVLLPVARSFSSSNVPELRRPLIYFAGTPFPDENTATRNVKNELLDLLCQHEQGETTETIVWKLFQSARLYPKAAKGLALLCERFDVEVVSGAMYFHVGSESLDYQAMKEQWNLLPNHQHEIWAALEGCAEENSGDQ